MDVEDEGREVASSAFGRGFVLVDLVVARMLICLVGVELVEFDVGRGGDVDTTDIEQEVAIEHVDQAVGLGFVGFVPVFVHAVEALGQGLSMGAAAVEGEIDHVLKDAVVLRVAARLVIEETMQAMEGGGAEVDGAACFNTALVGLAVYHGAVRVVEEWVFSEALGAGHTKGNIIEHQLWVRGDCCQPSSSVGL